LGYDVDQLLANFVQLRGVVDVAAKVAIYSRIHPDTFVVQESKQIAAVLGVIKDVAAACLPADTLVVRD
jgi:hypothetical protein